MKWLKPTLERVERVGRLMRHQDRLEVFYSHGLEAESAAIESWRMAAICRCIGADNGAAVGICGVSGKGVIWLLATDELLASAADRRQFVREGRKWVASLLTQFPVLENWALASNVTTLRWLRWLGFTVDTAQPMGRSCQLFCHFWRAA